MTTGRDEPRVLEARLGAQLLQGGSSRSPAGVVSRLLALQAQDLASGLWAIGVRSPGSTLAEVLGSLEDGSVVRSWPMRGTLHLVAAEDLGWILALGVPRVRSTIAARHRQLELDAETFARSRDITEAMLGGGRRAGRDELLAAHTAAGIPITGQRGSHLLMELAMSGVVCWGPPSGKQQSLVLTEEWIHSPRTLEPDEALGEFVVRYLAGHGPATVADVTWWSKLTVAQVKRGLDIAGDRVEAREWHGVPQWSTAETETVSAPRPTGAPSVLALPGFDELLLGYRDRGLSLPTEYAERVAPGANGIFLPMITVDGRIVGTWRRRIGPKTVTITPEPFAPLGRRVEAGFRRAVTAYGRFLGLPVELVDPTASD
jgi:hypothetical protein